MSGPKSGKPIDPTLAARYVASPSWQSKVREEADGCLRWIGATNEYGYGFCTIRYGVYKAHRIAWVAANDRDIPAGMVIDHLCRRRDCVNPVHLRIVPVRDNIVAFGSQNLIAEQVQRTYCKRGHELIGPNLLNHQLKKGKRSCRSCMDELRQLQRAAAASVNLTLKAYLKKYGHKRATALMLLEVAA